MGKQIIYYLIGGLLAALLLVYSAYYVIFLIARVSAVSEKILPKTPEVVTFNLEKFNELKIPR